jgi:hypothetical protein
VASNAARTLKLATPSFSGLFQPLVDREGGPEGVLRGDLHDVGSVSLCMVVCACGRHGRTGVSRQDLHWQHELVEGCTVLSRGCFGGGHG